MTDKKELYEVLKETGNGLRIAGQMRAPGDQVVLTDAEAQFLLLEGVIGLVQPASSAPSKKKGAD